MAELADALGSGPSGRNLVQVQILFRASAMITADPASIPAASLRPARTVLHIIPVRLVHTITEALLFLSMVVIICPEREKKQVPLSALCRSVS